MADPRSRRTVRNQSRLPPNASSDAHLLLELAQHLEVLATRLDRDPGLRTWRELRDIVAEMENVIGRLSGRLLKP